MRQINRTVRVAPMTDLEHIRAKRIAHGIVQDIAAFISMIAFVSGMTVILIGIAGH